MGAFFYLKEESQDSEGVVAVRIADVVGYRVEPNWHGDADRYLIVYLSGGVQAIGCAVSPAVLAGFEAAIGAR